MKCRLFRLGLLSLGLSVASPALSLDIISQNPQPHYTLGISEANLDSHSIKVDQDLDRGILIASRSKSKDNGVDRAFDKVEKRRQKSQKHKYWYLLPFGIPQFTEGYRGIGAGLAVGQVGSLALYFDRRKKVEAGNNEAANITRGLSPQQAAQNPFIVNFLNQNEKNVKDAQKEAQYFLLGFVGLYAFSVYEALYDPFDFRKVDMLRKKKSRDRDKDRDEEQAQRRETSQHRIGFMILPQHDASPQIQLAWQTSLR